MRVLLVDSCCGIRSTGRIVVDLASEFEKNGHEVKIAYGREYVPEKYQKYAVRIGSDIEVYLSVIHTRFTDCHGFSNKMATYRFLKWADSYNPDLLWLHCIHGYYINVEMLFDWIKSRPSMQVRWTLHDCWAFTGHCSYFTVAQCDKWKKHCQHCVEKGSYPSSIWKDNSSTNFDRKYRTFTGVKNMVLITPSNWLADLVKQSFLKEYPIEVMYNKVDKNVFKPTPSDFRRRNGLENKKIILGVASAWSEAKGLNVFCKLSSMLNDTYAIVLVGLTKAQAKKIPARILCIYRTNNTQELAEIYTAADLFVNPSLQETFGMTTVEAAACGTKVIVYKNTACEEIVNKFACGVAIEQGIENVYKEIVNLLG